MAKIDILKELTGVWRDTQDIDRVLEYLTDDIVWHYSAVTLPPKHGKDGAREFLEAYKERVSEPRWRIFDYAERDDKLFVEGIDSFKGPNGNYVEIPYMGIYEFRGDLICAWRDYFDRSVANAWQTGASLPDYARPLADREEI